MNICQHVAAPEDDYVIYGARHFLRFSNIRKRRQTKTDEEESKGRTTRAYGLERSSRYRQIEVTEDAWTTTRQGFTSADVRLLTASINNARRNRQNMLLRQIAHERLQDIIDSTYEDLSHKMLN